MSIPQNVAFLERGIRRLHDTNDKANRMRVLMANAVLGQMLPAGVVRGGTSLKFRYGERATRFTMDFDTAQPLDVEDFRVQLEERLMQGWSVFSGRLVPTPRARSAARTGLPEEYLMTPFYVKLSYRGHSWCTVKLEVSPNEIGDADVCEEIPVPPEVARTFETLDLPVPSPIPAMTLAYQIAQKVHGVTKPGTRRVQDLIDLQLIAKHSKIPYKQAGLICRRLFAYRQQQPWPSNVAYGHDWETLYAEAATGMDVLPSIEEAVPWGNAFIAKLHRYSRTGRRMI